MTETLFTPLTLPNGTMLPNRIAKAAMEENLADIAQLPGKELFQLYKSWSLGGAGLLITGNVMIDHRSMTGPGGVILEKDTDLTHFKTWASTVHDAGSKIWMQISHPGRQMPTNVDGLAIAPSAIQLNLGKFSDRFSQPEAMTETQIDEVIQRFTDTALQAQNAGFDGIQIHAAHGYLISQFLSPLSNQREDKWGGSLENRAKFLIEITKSIRAAVDKDFAVAIKLNSADFQRGGFSPDDAKQVVLWLNDLSIDLIELSGGSYESPAMQGSSKDENTLSREAYFLEFASDIATVSKIPVMTTGGIRRLEIANQVLEQGVSVVGMGVALAYHPTLPNQWKDGNPKDAIIPAPGFKNKMMNTMAVMALAKRQIRRIARNKKTRSKLNPLFTMIVDQFITGKKAKRYLAWRDSKA